MKATLSPLPSSMSIELAEFDKYVDEWYIMFNVRKGMAEE
jgi:hypothetical protein